LTIAEALGLTALVARKQPHRYGRFAARWLCLYLEEHEKGTLEDVAPARLEPGRGGRPLRLAERKRCSWGGPL
jgi:hypothetical protein